MGIACRSLLRRFRNHDGPHAHCTQARHDGHCHPPPGGHRARSHRWRSDGAPRLRDGRPRAARPDALVHGLLGGRKLAEGARYHALRTRAATHDAALDPRSQRIAAR